MQAQDRDNDKSEEEEMPDHRGEINDEHGFSFEQTSKIIHKSVENSPIRKEY